MMALNAHVRVQVCIAAIDFRKGIDGLARVCREVLSTDPFSGTVYVFRNRRGTAIKLLAYDGQGFWLCQKRLSSGRFRHWPDGAGAAQRELLSHQLQVLLAGGDAEATRGAPMWRRLDPRPTPPA